MRRRGVLAGGVRLALSLLTILPVGGAKAPDRSATRVAMSLAPAVGALVGLLAGGFALAATVLGATSLLAAVIAVGAGALLTRGLHLDGLADTVDGLGSYRDPESALAIMRKPDVGPFGVVAIVLVLLAQVAAAAQILSRAWPAALAGVVAACTAGRLGIALGCGRGVPAARPSGLGALVAGTVGRPAIVLAALGAGAIAVAAVPGRPWQGAAAVALSLAGAALLLRHATRRLGGITGDVLGALSELATTITYVVLSM